MIGLLELIVPDGVCVFVFLGVCVCVGGFGVLSGESILNKDSSRSLSTSSLLSTGDG